MTTSRCVIVDPFATTGAWIAPVKCEGCYQYADGAKEEPAEETGHRRVFSTCDFAANDSENLGHDQVDNNVQSINSGGVVHASIVLLRGGGINPQTPILII
jgi:hypothetical protein